MSGYVGAVIAGINTLTEWGLILCADLVIADALLKEKRVDLPGADGSLDLSYALTNGVPTYYDREISFTLAKPVPSDELWEAREALAALCHGRVATLALPVDEAHYFRGTFSVGGIAGDGTAVIPVRVTAEPYAYKNNQTIVPVTIPAAGTIDVVLQNEQRIVVPSFRASAALTITQGVNTYALAANTDVRFPSLKLQAGSNALTVAGPVGSTMTITYQEARI